MAEIRAPRVTQGRLMRLEVDKVKVGKRGRVDLGDIESLATSIRKVSLLHPIVVDSKHQLVAGARRLAAWRLARPGEAIPAIVCASLDAQAAALVAERDENDQRKPLTPLEAVEIGRELEKVLKPLADANRAANLKQASPSGKAATSEPVGKVRDAVGSAVGMSGRSYEKAKEVVEATHDPAPEVKRVARAAVKQMDKTGKVDAAHRAVREAKQAADPVDQDRLLLRSKVSKAEKQAFESGLFSLEPSLVRSIIGPDERVAWKARAQEAHDWFEVLLA